MSKLKQYSVVLVITVALWIFIEMIFARHIHNLPIRFHYIYPEGIRPLAQTSKAEKLPNNYIAVVGDSYAAGKGSWYDKISKMSRESFHSTHVIYQITGRDVITFGRSGAGNIRGMVELPVGKFEYMKSVYPNIESPSEIVVYFYEGNDLNDNRRDVSSRYPYDDIGALLNKEIFSEFVDQIVVNENEFMRASKRGLLNHLNLTLRIVEEVKQQSTKHKDWERDPMILAKNSFLEFSRGGEEYEGPRGYNRINVNDKVIKVEGNFQSPSLELTEDEIDISIYIFEQALIKMKEYFPDSHINVIYIPSPAASYEIVDDTVSIRTYEGRSAMHPTTKIVRYSDMICSKIKNVTQRHNVEFFDFRGTVRDEARKTILHGPSDWQHFNEKGYRLLGNAVGTFLSENSN